jgi:hypothetical protein
MAKQRSGSWSLTGTAHSTNGWADGRWGAIYAFPSVTNAASNAICRTLGSRLVDTTDFEYRGRTLMCNHWRIDPPEELPSA